MARGATLNGMTLPVFVLRDASASTISTAFPVGSNPQLPDAVQRHAFKAMRLAAGDEFQVTDGHGLRVTLRVDDAQAGLVTVTEAIRESAPAVRLGLIQALAKGGRDEQAIETSTEIGVDSVMPWQANRSIVQWKGAKAAKALAKWEDVLIAATEQSRRAYAPQLEDLHTTKQLTAWIGEATQRGDMVIVLHQDATDTWAQIEHRAAQVAQLAQAAQAAAKTPSVLDADDSAAMPTTDGNRAGGTTAPTIWVIVGPEGGIADEEVAAFVRAGAVSCVIGSTILRASTAGPVALTLLSRAIGRY